MNHYLVLINSNRKPLFIFGFHTRSEAAIAVDSYNSNLLRPFQAELWPKSDVVRLCPHLLLTIEGVRNENNL